MSLPHLGDLLDFLFGRVKRDAGALPDQLMTGTGRVAFRNMIERAYFDGSRAGYVAHGSYLGAARNPSKGMASDWRDAAITQGATIASRLDKIVARNGWTTGLQITNYATLAGIQSVWGGQDTAGNELAKLMDVQWKEWTRAWARRQHRSWHDELDGVIIPESREFRLPGGPHQGNRVHGPRAWDDVGAADEWINCGHALKFHREVTHSSLSRTMRGIGTVYSPPTAGPRFGGTP